MIRQQTTTALTAALIVIVAVRERVGMIDIRIEKAAAEIDLVIMIMIGAVIESVIGTEILIGVETRTANATVIVIVDEMIVGIDGMTGRDLLVMIVAGIAIEIHRVEGTTCGIIGGMTEGLKVARRMDVHHRTNISVTARIAQETIIVRTSRR